MTLSLIGGRFKGRRLATPKSKEIRPTTAVLRKAVFDICQSFIEEASFLDLFAGTGAMGFEALSRGASHVTFIEQHKEALDCLQKNCTLLEVQSQCTLLKGDAHLLLKRIKKGFDIIYIDPPYGKISLDPLLREILSRSLLNPGGTLFIEESTHEKEPLSLPTLTFLNARRFGKTLLHQWRLSQK